MDQNFEGRLKQLQSEIIRRRKGYVEARSNLHLNAAENQERAANLQLASDLERRDIQDERRIAAIENALQRLYAGEYATCSSCLDEIPIGRLEVVPWADMCIVCAEKVEGSKSSMR